MFEEKNIIRTRVKAMKSSITDREKQLQSENIFGQIENMAVFKKARVFLCYWSLSDEINTHGFINKWWKHKIILLPVIDNNEIKLKLFSGENNLKKSLKLGLSEPVGEDYTTFDNIDLAIIPGIAFDKKNNRMGRGKGYYDRFLPKINAFKLGVCFNFQIFEEIPFHEKDVKMDQVIYKQG